MDQTLVNRLHEIDLAWQNRRPLALQEILEIPQNIDKVAELAELLAADSEWRWRKAGFGETVPAEAGCNWQDLRPRRVETYIHELPELVDTPEATQVLIESEFMARSRWGNPPLIAEFVDRFPHVEGLEQRLRDSLDELSMVYVRRLGGPTGDHTPSPSDAGLLPISTPLSIGRQSMNEPRDTFLLAGRMRLIVVDNYQHGVSRRHGVVKRQSLDRCMLSNVSPYGQMLVNGEDLPPGACQTVFFPFQIEIGGVRLQFCHR